VAEEAQPGSAERSKLDHEAARLREEARFWRNLEGRLEALLEDLREDPTSWVAMDEDAAIVLRPVVIGRHARRLLWRHGSRFLLLSATMLAPEVIAGELSTPDGGWACLSLPSTFPAKNRPVIFRPVASMAHRYRERSLPRLVQALDEILDRHPGRVLVHSQSWPITKQVVALSQRQDRLLSYTPGGRDEALRRFKSPEGRHLVLIGPSVKRGVDLPDDLCEAVVVLVVPRLDWKDARVQARLRRPGGQVRYDAESVRQLVQMTGWGMRHERDHCVSYILDSEFAGLILRRQALFPGYWLGTVELERVS
jgi:Rad3-related DNA helicase